MELYTLDTACRLPSTARALWIEGPGRCSMIEEKLEEAAADEIIIRNIYSGISRGTEALILAGGVPKSEYERMRAPHMAGEFPFPVKYGYASVGVVEKGEEELLGKTVFCLFPHQDRFIAKAAFAAPIPRDLPPQRAILAANMETALNVVWDAGIQPGDRVAVFGAGVVGSLVAHLSSRIAGTDTVIVDNNTERQNHALCMDLDFTTPDCLTGEFDVLINASASPDALGAALDHAAMEAKIVEASWYGDRLTTIPLGGAFHSRRLSIVSSQVGAVPAARARRWSFNRRMGKALELLRDDRIDHLISAETAFADLASDYPRILSSPATLCHRIRY